MIKNLIIDFLGGYTPKEYFAVVEDCELLNNDVEELEKDLDEMQLQKDILDETLTGAAKENNEWYELYGHKTNHDTYMDWLDKKLKPSSKRHNINGNTTMYPINHRLKQPWDDVVRSLADQRLADIKFKYIEGMTANDIVREVRLKRHAKFKAYVHDRGKYGVKEYWETFIEAMIEVKAGLDCDGYTMVDYVLIRRALELANMYEENKHKLFKGWVSNPTGQHLSLFWIWEERLQTRLLNVESTYWADRFYHNLDKDVFDSQVYIVKYLFSPEGIWEVTL